MARGATSPRRGRCECSETAAREQQSSTFISAKTAAGSSSRAHSLAANGGKLRSSFPTDQPAKRPLGRTSEAGASASAERRRLFCPFLIHAQWIKKIKVENLVENYAQ